MRDVDTEGCEEDAGDKPLWDGLKEHCMYSEFCTQLPQAELHARGTETQLLKALLLLFLHRVHLLFPTCSSPLIWTRNASRFDDRGMLCYCGCAASSARSTSRRVVILSSLFSCPVKERPAVCRLGSAFKTTFRVPILQISQSGASAGSLHHFLYLGSSMTLVS